MNKPTKCPNCKSNKIKPIVYGLMRKRSFWEYLFPKTYIAGGCCVDEDSPTWFCARCKNTWGVDAR